MGEVVDMLLYHDPGLDVRVLRTTQLNGQVLRQTKNRVIKMAPNQGGKKKKKSTVFCIYNKCRNIDTFGLHLQVLVHIF